MEQGEQDHITKHLPDLIKFTECHELLLADLRSKRFLSEADLAILLDPQNNKLEKSRKFYEILMTRSNSFKALKQALFKVHQSGAYNILNEYGGSESERTFKCHGHITYNSEELLGKGSRETKVYQGTFCNRNVAVKVLIRDLIDVDVALQEVKILEDIDWHENIVRYYHTEVTKKKVFIALELCIMDLDTYVREHGNTIVLATPEEILRQATNGLAHLHKCRLVHRDLKPANIMICRHGDGVIRIKISDFGISKKLEDGETSWFAPSSSRGGGTEGWMAPEVIWYLYKVERRRRSSIDHEKTMSRAVDIFALGCIYFFVLSKGYHPFDPSIHRKSNIARDQPESFKPELIHEIRDKDVWMLLIQEMIAHDPSKRPKVEHVLERLPNSQMVIERAEPAPTLHKKDNTADHIHSRGTECAPEEHIESSNFRIPPPNNEPDPNLQLFISQSELLKDNVALNEHAQSSSLTNASEHNLLELNPPLWNWDTIEFKIGTKFLTPPTALTDFVRSTDNVLVLETHDIKLSIDRISDTITSASKIISVVTFDNFQLSRELGIRLTVINANTPKADVLDELLSKLWRSNGKFVVVCQPTHLNPATRHICEQRGSLSFDSIEWNDLTQEMQDALIKKLDFDSGAVPFEGVGLINLISGKICTLKSLVETYVNEKLQIFHDTEQKSALYLQLNLIAVQSIFSESANLDSDSIRLDHDELEKLVENGLLEKEEALAGSNNKYKFKYVSVSQYFAAAACFENTLLGRNRYFLNVVTRQLFSVSSCLHSVIDLTMDSFRFTNEKALYFLNAFTGDGNTKPNLFRLHDPINPREVALASLESNFKNLLQYALGQITTPDVAIVLIAVQKGNFENAKLVLEHYFGMTGGFRVGNSDLEGQQSDVVNTKHLNLGIRTAIHVCIWNTFKNPESQIEDRKKIIEEFLQRDRSLLREKYYHGGTESLPLFVDRIHLELIKLLIAKGADVQPSSVKSPKPNISTSTISVAHHTAGYLTPHQYHNLIEYLIDHGFKNILKIPTGSNLMSALHWAVRKMEVKSETIALFRDSVGINLNVEDNLGDTLMSAAVKGGRGAKYLKMLIHDLRVDWEKQLIIHVAAKHGNVEALRYFVGEKKEDIHQKDEKGMRPIQVSFQQGDKNIHEVVHTLLELGANVNGVMFYRSSKVESRTVELLQSRGAIVKKRSLFGSSSSFDEFKRKLSNF